MLARNGAPAGRMCRALPRGRVGPSCCAADQHARLGPAGSQGRAVWDLGRPWKETTITGAVWVPAAETGLRIVLSCRDEQLRGLRPASKSTAAVCRPVVPSAAVSPGQHGLPEQWFCTSSCSKGGAVEDIRAPPARGCPYSPETQLQPPRGPGSHTRSHLSYRDPEGTGRADAVIHAITTPSLLCSALMTMSKSEPWLRG